MSKNIRFKGIVATLAQIAADAFAGRISWASDLARPVHYYTDSDYAVLARKDVAETFPGVKITNQAGPVARMVQAGTDGTQSAVSAETARTTIGALASSEKGSANGVAPLGSDSKIAATYLPSYVDDVIEVANYVALPGTGEAGKIYVTMDTNRIYRWSGSAYVEISASLALGETSSTAYRGDRGKTAYDHSQITAANPHGTTFAQIVSKPTTLSGYGITDAQPLDSDLTAIAALSTQAFGRSLLTQADAAAARTTLGVSNTERLDARIGYTDTTTSWFRFAKLSIVSDYSTANCSCVVTDAGLSGNSNKGFVIVYARIRLNGAMSAALTYKNLEIETSGTTPYEFGYVVEQDDATEKRVALYCKTPIYCLSQISFLATQACTFYAMTSPITTEPTGIVYATPTDKKVGSVTATKQAGTGSRMAQFAADGTISALADAASARALIDAAQTAHTHTVANLSNLGANWSGLLTSAKPTTLAGYGITDAQPLDSDLTAIAALSTQAFGRSLLTQADAAAARAVIDTKRKATVLRPSATPGNGVSTEVVWTTIQVDLDYIVDFWYYTGGGACTLRIYDGSQNSSKIFYSASLPASNAAYHMRICFQVDNSAGAFVTINGVPGARTKTDLSLMTGTLIFTAQGNGGAGAYLVPGQLTYTQAG